MELYNITTNTSIEEQDFRYANRDKSLPLILTKEILEPYNLVPVLPGNIPIAEDHQKVVRDGVILDSEHNNYLENWIIVNMPLPDFMEKLNKAKSDKNTEINAARANANGVSFYHAGKNIACDELSKTDIICTGLYVSLFGTFAPGFPNAWKAVDNTYLSLPNIDAFKSMYASMVNAGNSNFMHAQQLKQELAAATTVEQINSITW